MRLPVGPAAADLYDTVAGEFIRKQVCGDQKIALAPDQAAVLVIVPANLKASLVGRQLQLNGITIDYRASR